MDNQKLNSFISGQLKIAARVRGAKTKEEYTAILNEKKREWVSAFIALGN